MKLTLVGLPLGNIQDISLRAIETLKNAQLIICEDTRVFYKLWQKLVNLGYLTESYQGKLLVINEFNEKSKVDQIIGQLKGLPAESTGILVSDAGQPAFSDPGFVLTQKVIEAGGEVDIIPGPTAAMTALALSGFSPDRVLYLGFLPKKTAKRNKNWLQIKSYLSPSKVEGEARSAEGVLTVIIYESPLRVAKTLAEINLHFGDGLPCVIARELTKQHQQVLRGTVLELLTQIKQHPLKGEVVLLLRV